MRLFLWSCLLLVAGCALPKTVPEALSPDFKPTGEVSLRGNTASFDAWRVRAPNCNLSKRTDGSWGGTLSERAIDVSATETQIRGVEMTMTREHTPDGKEIITGQFLGKIARFEFDGERAIIRTQRASVTLLGRVVGEQVVSYGSLHELELRGEAGGTTPPWPQMAFALMAAFN
jgi:hypothetical protein